MPISEREKEYIRQTYHTLVVQDLIRIKKISEYGDCVPGYTEAGKRQLVGAIRELGSVTSGLDMSTDKLPGILTRIEIQALLRAHPKYEQKMAEWASANIQPITIE